MSIIRPTSTASLRRRKPAGQVATVRPGRFGPPAAGRAAAGHLYFTPMRTRQVNDSPTKERAASKAARTRR